MNKNISLPVLIVGLLGSILLLVLPAEAQYGLQNTARGAGYNLTATGTSMLQTVISTVLSLVAIAFLGLMLYAGLRWMTAKGNEEKVTNAKDIMEAAIIGFIIVVLSYGLSSYIFRLLANQSKGSDPLGCCEMMVGQDACSVENINNAGCTDKCESNKGCLTSPNWKEGACTSFSPTCEI